MKFRRNIKEQKFFLILAIVFYLVLIVSIILHFATLANMLGMIALCAVTTSIFLIIVYMESKSYILFEDNGITIINENFLKKRKIFLELESIQEIKIPSKKALQKKLLRNYILILCRDKKRIISYSEEIKNYLLEHFDNISYYDKYLDVMK